MLLTGAGIERMVPPWVVWEFSRCPRPPSLCVWANLFIADGLTYVVPVFIRSARVFAMASACSVPVRGGSLEWTKEPFG